MPSMRKGRCQFAQLLMFMRMASSFLWTMDSQQAQLGWWSVASAWAEEFAKWPGRRRVLEKSHLGRKPSRPRPSSKRPEAPPMWTCTHPKSPGYLRDQGDPLDGSHSSGCMEVHAETRRWWWSWPIESQQSQRQLPPWQATWTPRTCQSLTLDWGVFTCGIALRRQILGGQECQSRNPLGHRNDVLHILLRQTRNMCLPRVASSLKGVESIGAHVDKANRSLGKCVQPSSRNPPENCFSAALSGFVFLTTDWVPAKVSARSTGVAGVVQVHGERRTPPEPGRAPRAQRRSVEGCWDPFWRCVWCHVWDRPGLQETGAVSGRESVATTIFSSQSKGKRDRDTNVVHSPKDIENLQKILERKVDSGVRSWGWGWGKKLGKRDIPTLLFRRSIKNLNLIAFNCTKQVDGQKQAQRDKISLYGEVELRNRLFRENHARDCQGIEELRRICCEEADRARTSKKWWIVFTTREGFPQPWVNWWLRFGNYRTKWILCPIEENITNLNQGAGLEGPTLPIEVLLF